MELNDLPPPLVEAPVPAANQPVDYIMSGGSGLPSVEAPIMPVNNGLPPSIELPTPAFHPRRESLELADVQTIGIVADTSWCACKHEWLWRHHWSACLVLGVAVACLKCLSSRLGLARSSAGFLLGNAPMRFPKFFAALYPCTLAFPTCNMIKRLCLLGFLSSFWNPSGFAASHRTQYLPTGLLRCCVQHRDIALLRFIGGNSCCRCFWPAGNGGQQDRVRFLH